jgi:hypothetical protein
MGSDAAGCTDFKANSQGQLRNIPGRVRPACLKNKAFAHGLAPGARLICPSVPGVSDGIKESATTLWGFSTMIDSLSTEASARHCISIALIQKGS